MELTSLYDKNRKPLNKSVDKYSTFNEGEYMEIVHVCIFNKNKEMLIHKRALNKIDQPGKWDISSGGGVLVNESVNEAISRELFEELGVKYDFTNERVYLTVHYDTGFDDYYLILLDKNIADFTINKEEVLDLKWASKEEILKMMEMDEFIRYNEGFIQLLFAMFDNRGTYPKRG